MKAKSFSGIFLKLYIIYASLFYAKKWAALKKIIFKAVPFLNISLNTFTLRKNSNPRKRLFRLQI